MLLSELSKDVACLNGTLQSPTLLASVECGYSFPLMFNDFHAIDRMWFLKSKNSHDVMNSFNDFNKCRFVSWTITLTHKWSQMISYRMLQWLLKTYVETRPLIASVDFFSAPAVTKKALLRRWPDLQWPLSSKALRLLCLSVILDPLQGLQEHSFEAQTFLLFFSSTKQLEFEKCERKKSKRNLIRNPNPKCHTPPSAWWCTPARCTL